MVSTAHDLNRERQWACARRMTERRHALGLTQCDVVERLVALGMAATNRTLSAMEHGQGVDVGRLPEVAVALDCTITYLLGLTGEAHRWVPDDISVPVTVDITAPTRQDAAVHESWILGPDIPDRGVPEIREARRA
jgi:transcriptional regulator with XRE-family HTH domain